MDEVEDRGTEGWLEAFEKNLLEQLAETKDRRTARRIIETLCTGRTGMFPFDWSDPDSTGNHDNEIDEDLAKRIVDSTSPAIMDYNARIARWGYNPQKYPPLPNNEWALVMFEPYLSDKKEN